jgi:hypothetical protein
MAAPHVELAVRHGLLHLNDASAKQLGSATISRTRASFGSGWFNLATLGRSGGSPGIGARLRMLRRRPCRARPCGRMARRALSPRRAGGQMPFTRGSGPHRFAPSERQEQMHTSASRPSIDGLPPGLPGVVRLGSVARATPCHRNFPDLANGPHLASLSSRRTAAVPAKDEPTRRTAHWSSGLNDEAHADRRHTRGRNPRRGAGR